ncbi:MAG TPA: bifunctional glycosyltransferase/class I SAM-dependent methyltransferase [Solirubrobacteraceae bacterium]|nr:bifunctional glycosyltransferase/class I SAM-dependent methyltransferase [Solirubrobacteraceae bacterium]
MSDGHPRAEVAGSEFAVTAGPKIGIVVVAYNAASTLAQVLDRVPKDFRHRITRVFVCDDASEDSTYLVGLGYQQTVTDLPLTVIRHADNLGYGGNQKAGYRLAIEHELDIVVLLHGDGQYAPECLAEIVAPLERGECDAVMGSRMMVRGAARKGGMPLYKYVGNKLLTGFENRMLGTSLSEFHSGYRAYSVEALKSIPFERNSDGFNFDTQIIIQLTDAGKRIVEVPVPTYYGDEICYVNGLKYARDVSSDVVRYRLAKLGFASDQLGGVGEEYALKTSSDSSHAVILRWLEQLPPGKVLDLGCSGGLLAERARALGHRVVGVDVLELPEARGRVDQFIRADLDRGLSEEVEQAGPYDIVLAGDVLEHVREPGLVLEHARRVLVPRGTLIASVPNFGHWYVRTRAVLGIFDYDQRGLLDRTHVRFFTRRSIERELARAGFTTVRKQVTGLPLEVIARDGGKGRTLLRLLDRAVVALRPTLFGYQFLYHCEMNPAPVIDESLTPW